MIRLIHARASDALEALNDDIEMATNGYDRRGREIGVAVLRGTARARDAANGCT
ncbi:hypothetical protein [Nocardia sp. NBC_01009]|uniref:hypothetical protein n=1 Tax=Nocardia sp. NBC_01009 TaxID=2975996 RepID=UPI00387026A1|nr:hypothetical protein OHA42_04380 [Nocardia sp. NBC_01009]